MGGTEGQLAQVSPCLVPTFMVNTQHQVKHRPAGKPSYGNRHCRSKHFNYGSQTGRGLALSDFPRLLDPFLAGRNPRTLAAYQADLEDFRRFLETCSLYPPTPLTVGEAVKGLLENAEVMAGLYAREYRQQMRERGLQITTINRRLATLRSLVKLANTHGLVTWTLSVENVP